MLRFKQTESRAAAKREGMGTHAMSPKEHSAGPQSDLEVERVRPEELTAALNAIEARRGQVLSETIPLGVAIRELQLGVTTEEVWQEIAARRSATATDSLSRTLRPYRGPLQAVAVIASLIAIALSVRAIAYDKDWAAYYAKPSAVTQPTGPTVSKPASLMGMRLFVKTATTLPLSRVPEGMPILLPFSEVHDLRNALCGSEYAQRLTPEDAANILVETKRVTPGYTWQVVRLTGKYYLRAWTLKAIPLGDARDQKVPLFCQPFRPGTRDDGSRVQISIPLDAIGSYESTSDGVEETAKAQVTNLDARAWEAWKAPTIPPPLAGSSSSVGR